MELSKGGGAPPKRREEKAVPSKRGEQLHTKEGWENSTNQISTAQKRGEGRKQTTTALSDHQKRTWNSEVLSSNFHACQHYTLFRVLYLIGELARIPV